MCPGGRVRQTRVSVIPAWLQSVLVHRRTRKLLRNVADRLMRDVLLPDGVGGQVSVDALLLRDSRLYLLHILHVNGAIFAGDKMDRWTVIGKRERLNFRNPLHRLQDQVFALRTLVPELALEPRVLFIGHAYFPKGRPDGVQLFEEFVQPLRRRGKRKPLVLPANLEAAWMRLCAAAGVLPGKETPVFTARLPDTPTTTVEAAPGETRSSDPQGPDSV